MDYTLENFNDYKTGLAKGLIDAKNGVSEEDSCTGECNEFILKGIHDGYLEFLKEVFDSSIKEAIQNKSLLSISKVADARAAFLSKITDEEYSIRKINPNQYSVDKDGKHDYTIFKNSKGFWECSCVGFQYRHDCKHMHLFKQMLGQSPNRLPQHLARVRALENSLKIWEDRLKEDPSNKIAQKNVSIRKAALEEAKKKAAEIEAQPKPQRHPREEFEAVIPLLDKLFSGIADYEIVGSWRRGKCFAAGTKVRTISGWVSIEELKVGDLVFNGKGELTEVTRTFKEKQKEWCRISYRRDSSLVCTPDHRFLVWKSASPRKDFEWEQAQHLGKSRKWKILTPLIKLPQDVSIGKEKAFILGWYLSDGNMHLYDREEGKTQNFKLEYLDGGFYNVTLAANSTRSRQLLHLIAELGLKEFSFYANDKDNSQEIQIRDKWLLDFILEWGGFTSGRRNIEKTPSSEILNLVADEKKAFLEGFWLGDGTYGKYNSTESVRLFNTNKSIVEQLDLLLSEHYRTLRYEREQEGNKKCYEVRISGNDAASFIQDIPGVVLRSKYVDNRERTCEGIKVKKQFEAIPQNVTGVELFEEEGYRYCIEVRDGESFIAENFAVHNSTYKDCDIITPMTPNQWKELKSRLENDPNFVPAPGHIHIDWGDEVIRGGYKNGDRVDYLDINRVPNPNELGSWMLFRTGSAKFNVAMRGWLKKFGCGLSERGLIDPQGQVVASKTEEDIFDAISIPFIKPEDREDARKFYQEVKDIEEPAFLKEYREHYEPSIPMSDSKISDCKTLDEKIPGGELLFLSSEKYPVIQYEAPYHRHEKITVDMKGNLKGDIWLLNKAIAANNDIKFSDNLEELYWRLIERFNKK